MKEKIKNWFDQRNIKNYDIRLSACVDGYDVRMFHRITPQTAVVVSTVISKEADVERLQLLVDRFEKSRLAEWKDDDGESYYYWLGD